MGWLDSIGKSVGSVTGGLAGIPGGIPGMIGGGYIGNKIGGLTQRSIFGSPYEAGDYSGMAGYPSYVGMEPDQLAISGEFGGPNEPLNKFSSESMRNGPSSGTQFALQQNRLGANEGRDQARRFASGMAKDATANLAMKGGLGAGAQERIGKYATNVGMEGAQQADANAAGNRAGILIADENARTGNLAQASGLITADRTGRYNMKAGDLARQQGELDRRNAFNMNNYNQQMAAWGAGKQADATAKSGKK